MTLAFSLNTYPDSVGITYYLVHRLAQVEEVELDFYWPQICHLVISHASESGALEGLIVKKCEESIHLAMLVRVPPQPVTRAVFWHI